MLRDNLKPAVHRLESPQSRGPLDQILRRLERQLKTLAVPFVRCSHLW